MQLFAFIPGKYKMFQLYEYLILCLKVALNPNLISLSPMNFK